MQVKELIELLQAQDPERQVILSKDTEGNGFSPAANEYSVGWYEPETAWSGEFNENLYDENSTPALVLWPVN